MKALARILASCALALCVAAPAIALSPANRIPDERLPYANRLAVVYDSDVYDSLNAVVVANRIYAITMRSSENLEKGRLVKLIREQGGSVTMFPSSYFKPAGRGGAQWATLGDTYPCVLFLGSNCSSRSGRAYVPDTAAILRFYDPESTTAQIIHYTSPDYVSENNTLTARRVGTGCYTGSVSWQPAWNVNGASGNGDGTNCAFVTSRGDSMFVTSFASGVAVRGTGMGAAVDSTHARVTSIVRLFTPAWPGAAMKLSTVTPQYSLQMSLYADSLVRTDGREALPIAWRVYWGSAGKHVDYVCMQMLDSYTNCTAQFAYALVSRYVKLAPVKAAYEWDDHGTFGIDDNSLASHRAWPYPDTLSNYRAMMRRYGMNPMLETTGGADSLYLMATTTQNGKTYPYLLDRSWYFVPHVHDSIGSHYLGNVMGIGTHIACEIGASGNFIAHRYAFRDSADITPGDEWARYGIYQRLVLHDSAYVAAFGAKPAPYLSFTNDISMPLDASLLSTYGMPGGPFDASSKLISPDSLFLAFACAGKRYIRGFTSWQQDTSDSRHGVSRSSRSLYGLRWGDNSIKTVGVGATTGILSASRYFSLPDQRYVVTVPEWARTKAGANSMGRATVRCVGTVAMTQTSAISAGTYDNVSKFRGNSQTVLPQIMGLTFARPQGTMYMRSDGIGTPSKIVQTPASGYSSLTLRNSDIARIRMLYQHPLSTRFGGGYDDWPVDKESLRVGVLEPLSALNTIAGHSLVRWVQPWEVFDK